MVFYVEIPLTSYVFSNMLHSSTQNPVEPRCYLQKEFLKEILELQNMLPMTETCLSNSAN